MNTIHLQHDERRSKVGSAEAGTASSKEEIRMAAYLIVDVGPVHDEAAYAADGEGAP